MTRMIDPDGGRAWKVGTGEEVRHPEFRCSACDTALGTAEPEYHDAAGDWAYCPWCGERL